MSHLLVFVRWTIAVPLVVVLFQDETPGQSVTSDATIVISELMYQIQRFHAFLWASGGAVSDFLIRAYPRHHTKSYARSLYKTAENCAACSKKPWC